MVKVKLKVRSDCNNTNTHTHVLHTSLTTNIHTITDIFTGRSIPSFMFFVCSLNSLQKSPIFSPRYISDELHNIPPYTVHSADKVYLS